MIRARKIFDYRACSCTSRAPVLPGLKSRRLLIRFGGPVRSCVPPHGVEIPIRHVETSSVPLFSALRRVIWILVYLAFSILSAFGGNTTNTPSRLIESAGQVEFVSSGGTNWQPAAVGLALKPGDRIRTLERSRAAVQLSDRSVIRLDQRTTLEILPPQRSERKRFGLPGGAVYFFNREKPADVEFDTPLAAGAIRGTEFLLEVADANAAVHLALIDGLVSLQTTNGEINIQRGDDLLLTPGRPPQKTSLVNAAAKIQWALYYPAVVDPDELQLDVAERKELEEVLKTYRSGDMLGALACWPVGENPQSEGERILHAQLELAVGSVNTAEALVRGLPENPAAAIRDLIAVVRGEKPLVPDTDKSASVQMARSYAFQAAGDLENARKAAGRAVEIAPQSGFAHARLAELEFAFGNRRAALVELRRALQLSPRLVSAHALNGFVLLDQGDSRAAMKSFDDARRFDAAFGPAWLGRGLCLLREREFAEARSAFQAAAALEPQRSLFRSYLGKAAGELHDSKGAEKEFRLAKELDPNDPTAWLYSALQLWQDNRLNAAIRDLETSSDLNDNRAVFRSGLLLDNDRSVRSADLAAIYDDAGLGDVSHHLAQRAVVEDYANFSGHLFLANSYQSQESVNGYDLRLETARQSELLVANLLAPPGAGNLSQVLSQQERLRFFDQRPVGLSSLTTYDSRGDWNQVGTIFGSFDGFSYAFDSVYAGVNGQRRNNDLEQRDFALTMKQRVTPDDEAYFQIGDFRTRAGDVSMVYDPAQASPGFRISEKQEPDVHAGWHHTWSQGSHSLLLLSRLNDRFSSRDPDKSILFLQTPLFGTNIIGVTQGPLPQFPTNQGPVLSELTSDFTLYSAELQHIWETTRYSLVVGGRWQHGDINTISRLSDVALGGPNPVTDQTVNSSLDRGDAYAYGSWQVLSPLRLIGGASYSHITYPNNVDLPPITAENISRELFSPKAGLLFQPWNRGLFRASYTKSLGGLYFDNSVRLEPTQVGGFNQAFRSLLPESVAGLVPGSEFESIAGGFDQSLAIGTFFGIEAEQLSSHGERDAGAFKLFTELLSAADAVSTRDVLDFRERNLSVYAGQLLGEYVSIAGRYRISDARLRERFPEIPSTAAGLGELARRNTAVLRQVSLTANFNHPSGVFGQWESTWFQQDNFGNGPRLSGDDFWQHNIFAGYRFPRRCAEIRLGVLNLFDEDYRLNPLNLHADLPRSRTFFATLRLNF